MGEAERGEAAPRQRVVYFCAHEHESVITFAVEAQIPESWDCPRCGLPDTGRPPLNGTLGDHAHGQPPSGIGTDCTRPLPAGAGGTFGQTTRSRRGCSGDPSQAQAVTSAPRAVRSQRMGLPG